MRNILKENISLLKLFSLLRMPNTVHTQDWRRVSTVWNRKDYFNNAPIRLSVRYTNCSIRTSINETLKLNRISDSIFQIADKYYKLCYVRLYLNTIDATHLIYFEQCPKKMTYCKKKTSSVPMQGTTGSYSPIIIRLIFLDV